MKTAVLAIGGNSILRAGEEATFKALPAIRAALESKVVATEESNR